MSFAFDITNVIESVFFRPNGIIRYERMLFQSIYLNYGKSIDYIYYDRNINEVFILNETDIEFLINILFNRRKIDIFYILKNYNLLSLKTKKSVRKNLKKLGNVNSVGLFLIRLFLKLLNFRRRQLLQLQIYNECVGRKLILSFMTTISMTKNSFYLEKFKKNLSIIFYDTVPLDNSDTTTDFMKVWFKKSFVNACSNSSEFLCISNYTKNCVITWKNKFNISNKLSYTILRSCSPLSVLNLCQINCEGIEAGKYVLYCSTIEPRKNHLLLLKIWKKLLDDGKKPIKLVLAGSIGWNSEPIFEFIEKFPELKSLVVFVGDIEDEKLIWLYQNTRFLVFPSMQEGWGLSVTEALDFNKPIILSDIEVFKEVSQNLMPMIDINKFDEWLEIIESWTNDDQIIEYYSKLIAEKYVKSSPLEIFKELY